MESKKIIIKREIKSHQTNEDGTPVINLIYGDIVECKQDGIYLTRKIVLNTDEEVLSTIFKSIEEQNLINPSLN
jgi:hypothetical protein